VLLVEDDAVSANVLRKILTRLGWQVAIAGTMSEGLAGLDDNPDAIILDLMLPDGDGEVILEKVRQMGLHTPVAVTTGVNDPARLRRIAALSPNIVLQKPIDLPSLLRGLQSIS
jgi:two-component system, NtrC family, response regulator AtoC